MGLLCNPRTLQIVQEMVKHGFVSASIEFPEYTGYDLSAFETKASALTNGSSSPLGILCALEKVDCSLGIASAGYSQGSHLAKLISMYMEPSAPHVTACLTVAGGAYFHYKGNVYTAVDVAAVDEHLPKERRRSVIIEGDGVFAPTMEDALVNQKMLSGYDCGDSIDCLQSSGSGYFIIPNADLPEYPEWFEALEKPLGWHEAIYDWTTFQFQPWFLDGPENWTMRHNLEWLAETAQS